MKRALVLLGLLLAPAAAWADPASIITALITNIGAFVISAYGAKLILVGLYIYGAARARKKARAAQAKAREAYNASLQDRSITALQALPPWRIVPGRATTGGDIHAIFTTDKTGTREDGASYTKPDALKHLVVVFADHEVKAIHDIFIDGVSLGALDGSGYVTSGEFFSTRTDSRVAVIGGGGTVTVPEPVLAFVNAYTRNGGGEDQGYTDVTGSVSGVGTTTISGPANATVNYTVQLNLPTVRVQKHLGTSTQAVDAYLNGLIPSLWTSTDRLLNKAYIVLTLDLENVRFQGGPPGVTADISGRKVYDPRKDSTVPGGSGAHRANDPTTWEWTDNAALAVRDYLQAEWGFDNDPADIDDAYTIAAANACDVRASAAAQSHSQAFTVDTGTNEIIFTNDEVYGVGDGIRVSSSGTLPSPLAAATTYYVICGDFGLKRYRLATTVANAYAGTAIDITAAGSGTHTCTWHDYATYKADGAFTTDDGGKEAVLDDLAEAMAGDVVYGAQWQIIAGGWTAPVVTLTDDDLAGQIEIVQADTPLEQLLNSVRGTFIPIGKSVPVEMDNYSNSTFVTDDGQELWSDIALPYTNSRVRARNLARIAVETGRNGQVIRYPAKLKAWPLQVGDRVSVTSTEYGFSAKSFRVTDWQFGLTSPVVLTLQEDASAAYDLADAATSDQTQNTDLPSPWVVQAISSVSATSSASTGLLAADGSWQPRVRVTWAAVTGAYLADGSGRIVVLWRDPRSNEWQRTEVASNETGAWVTGIREGDPLVIEVAARNGLGQYGPPSFVSHTVAVTQSPSTYQGTTLIAHGTTGALVIVGNSVTKVASGGAWNAGVYSKAPITGGCRVSFRVPRSDRNIVIGLNTDPTTDADYASIDYAINIESGPSVRVYESGVQVLNAGAFSINDEFAIEYDNTAIRYYNGATLLHQAGVASGKTLYLDSSFYDVDAKLTNIEFRPLSAAPRGNLIDPSTWVIGSSGSQGVTGANLFQAYVGTGTVNEIVLGTAPDGVQRPLWKGTAGSGDADGGWHPGGSVPVDHTKIYRWAVWTLVGATGADDGFVYMGALANSVAAITTGTVDPNPYFEATISRASLVRGRWYLLVGVTLPSTIGTSAPSPTLGGIYDGATGQRVAGATADYKWVSGQSQSSLRALVASATAGAIQYWWGPRLEMMDGTEPTIDQLLAVAKTGLTNNLQPDFESQFGLNGQFSNWGLTASLPDGWSSEGGTNSRETTTTRTGPNAVRSVSAGSAAGVSKQISFSGLPLAEGSFVEGTLDAYLVSHTSGGYPGLGVRLYTNSGLSTQRDTYVNLPNTTTGGWQTLPFKASVNPGERIYGVTFYLLSSSSALSGGHGTNTVIFDSLVARAVQPSDTLQLQPDAATKTHQAFEAGPVSFTTVT